MSPGPTISRYTPSVMGRDLLERLFVARDRLLGEVVRRIESVAASTERNHTLLVGPRGAGKTHLVSLVAHRTRDLMAEGRQVQLAWLPEDPWTLVTYRHLLAEVVSRLEPPFEGNVPRRPDELEAVLAQRAAELGPVVVVVENLDQILDAIGNDGQQRLRHLLQNDRSLLLVATSTTLDRSMSDQASPFYGFFTTSRLEPFDVDEAAAMLTAIAVEREDDALVDYLASDEGRARLRTIEHLAGGQPRMWAALASALTVDGLDELVDLLLTRFDDLTPYYQEQLGRLSGQQRLVVAELAEVDRPITVKELAERLEIDQRSLGKTVSDLVERRWMAETTSPVTAMLDRRRTYYELAEPMARLSFQIKDNRGEPLRVIVDFLKHWFDPEDLSQVGLLETARNAAEETERHVQAAVAAQAGDAVVAVTRRLVGLPAAGGQATGFLGEVDDALERLGCGVGDPFLGLPAPVRSALEAQLREGTVPVVRLRIHEAALNELEVAVTDAAAGWVDRAATLIAGAGEVANQARAELVRWLALAGRHAEARALLRTIERTPDELDRMYLAHAAVTSALALAATGDYAEAIEVFDLAAELAEELVDFSPSEISELATSLRDSRTRLQNLVAAVARANSPTTLGRALARDLPTTFPLCRVVVSALYDNGEVAEAAVLHGQILEACEAAWGTTDPRTIACRAAGEALGL